jgi:hypothetical protein
MHKLSVLDRLYPGEQLSQIYWPADSEQNVQLRIGQ